MRYAVFQTAWGWAGLAGDGDKVSRVVLPCSVLETVHAILHEDIKIHLAEDSLFLAALQRQICDYYAGKRVENWDCQIDLASLPAFTRQILTKAQEIPYGKVVTYGQLAGMCERPSAARAAGQAMSRNPIPLIIPCHRVLAAGSLGGFTAPGGLDTKKAMLRLEGANVPSLRDV
ncbi:MAG: methylated-DNA--[protein]-cysteine S-methyltransferase [Acidobacteriota bacterium]